MSIILNNNWDLSANLVITDNNGDKFSTKLPGCFDVNIATGEKIKTLLQKLIFGLTTNSAYVANITSQRNLEKIIEEEEENGN